MKTLPLVALLAAISAAGLSACMNDQSQRADQTQPGFATRTGQEVDDGVLTTKVKTALAAHDSLKTLILHVDSNQGIVTITGNVQTQDQYDTVTQVAIAVSGVRSVHNELTIKPNSNGTM